MVVIGYSVREPDGSVEIVALTPETRADQGSEALQQSSEHLLDTKLWCHLVNIGPIRCFSKHSAWHDT